MAFTALGYITKVTILSPLVFVPLEHVFYVDGRPLPSPLVAYCHGPTDLASPVSSGPTRSHDEISSSGAAPSNLLQVFLLCRARLGLSRCLSNALGSWCIFQEWLVNLTSAYSLRIAGLFRAKAEELAVTSESCDLDFDMWWIGSAFQILFAMF
jgi:hypothetical protein